MQGASIHVGGRSMRRAVVVFLLGCSHTSAPPPATPASAPATAPAAAIVPQAAPLAADTPTTTVEGNPFTAPASWTVTREGQKIVLTAPEGDARLALVDVKA